MTTPEPSEPESWRPARRGISEALVPKTLGPFERFFRVEAAGGIALVLATALAMAWINSSLRESYTQLWLTEVSLRIGGLELKESLHFLVNEGAMTLFFFLVGLELRREVNDGALSSARRAAFPALAAVGGMVLPALIFISLNHGLPSSRGWGIPIATDIAFAIGVLAVVGRRMPPAARAFLLALAVIDDIGAIVVIGVFYTASFSIVGVVVSLAGVAMVVVLRGLGVRRSVAYALPAIVVWTGLLMAGIHPTLSGVVLGMLTPLRSAGSETMAPASRLEAALHPWVAFGVMPLFALANAGVELGSIAWSGASKAAMATGIVLGLVFGKPLGILGFSYLATKLGLATRPREMSWRAVAAVGAIAGVGFTMAIFIADLAFADRDLLRLAKVTILLASTLAATCGGLLARRMRPASPLEAGPLADGSAHPSGADLATAPSRV